MTLPTMRAALSALLLFSSILLAADQPQWGQAWSRNMVSAEKGLPASFDLETGRNVQWVARLGTETHGTPIIADGRVFIGTNNGEPRDPAETGDCGVLMCFDEKNGQLLWQHAWPKRIEDPYFDWPKTGMSSPVTVEGDRAYVVNNRGEVVCLDVHGAGLGIAAKALWTFDLTSGAGIWSHDGAHSSILIRGPHLYLNTGTGVDNSHRVIRTPNAPSLVVIDKASGRLLARDDEHIAPNIFHCTWSSPALGEVEGRAVIFFAAGDGIVRAFVPLESTPAEDTVAVLRKVWQFDPDPSAPKEQVHRFTSNRQQGPSNIYGMPVPLGKRLYVAGGGDVFWGKNEAWLKCVDISKPGDATAAGTLWSYPLDRHTLSTPAVENGLVFVSDASRNVHCVDAETGVPQWVHPTRGDYWASPLVADGKVYIGSRKGDFWIFAAAREEQVLATVDFKKPISATPTAANGMLFVATMTHLYALREGAQLDPKRQ